MDRKDFFKKACLYGVCGCTAMPLLSMNKVMANTESEKEETSDWRVDFMKDRFAKLVELMNENIEESVKNKIFESVGQECSRLGFENAIKPYVGNIDAYIKDAETKWADRITYNKEKKEIVCVGKEQENCFCAFVDNKKTPKDFCNCSKGWQKETFKAILGQEIDEVKIESSILQGAKKCSFRIKVK